MVAMSRVAVFATLVASANAATPVVTVTASSLITNVYGGFYYTNSATPPAIAWTSDIASNCQCRLRANMFGWSSSTVSDPTVAQTETAADGAVVDSALEAVGYGYTACGTAATTTHSLAFGSLPDGYYTASVSCQDSAVPTAYSAVSVYQFKIDTVAPVMAPIEQIATYSYDPTDADYSPAAGFPFRLSAKDYYGPTTSPYYSMNLETMNKAACTAGTDCELSGLRYMCSMDNAAFADCGAFGVPGTYTSGILTAGNHVLRVKAYDRAGNTEALPTFYPFSIQSYNKIEGNAPTGCSYYYKLESGGVAGTYAKTASSGKTNYVAMTGLTHGSQEFSVYSEDAWGNAGAAAVFTWSVDTVPPVSTFTQTWSAQNSVTSTSGTFKWSIDSAASFSKYSTDGGNTYTITADSCVDACPTTATSTITSYAAPTGTFAIGSGSFKVKAIDEVGNAETAPITDSFTVQAIDTVLTATGAYDCYTGTATQAISSSSITFSISATIDTNTNAEFTYTYSLDNGNYHTGKHFPAFGLTGLSEGVHELKARAYTLGGVPDAVDACKKFIIDMTPPVTTITTAPSAIDNQVAPKIGGVVTDANIATAGTQYKLQLAGGATASYTSPGTPAVMAGGSFEIQLAGLVEGMYTISVKSTDMASNPETAPATYSWTVDHGAPETMVQMGPATPAPEADVPTFQFACDEVSCSYRYKIDSGASTIIPASAMGVPTIAAQSPGVHTIEVYSIDAAGNEDPTPAAYTWTVYDADMYASYSSVAGFSVTGVSPMSYEPPPVTFVHL